jgi:MFS family permease
MLPWLAAGAASAAAVLGLSGAGRPALVWIGAVGIGLFGVSANAVSMVAVMQAAPAAGAGRAAAVVSAGFFAGFGIGPAGGGVLADQFGYGWTWSAVLAAFVAAAVIAVVTTRTRVRDTEPSPARPERTVHSAHGGGEPGQRGGWR